MWETVNKDDFSVSGCVGSCGGKPRSIAIKGGNDIHSDYTVP